MLAEDPAHTLLERWSLIAAIGIELEQEGIEAVGSGAR
jgi:hypothetical protein